MKAVVFLLISSVQYLVAFRNPENRRRGELSSEEHRTLTAPQKYSEQALEANDKGDYVQTGPDDDASLLYAKSAKREFGDNLSRIPVNFCTFHMPCSLYLLTRLLTESF